MDRMDAMTRARQQPAPVRIDPELERRARDAFPELNDLQPGAEVILIPDTTDPKYVNVGGTLWDGRTLVELYRLDAAGDLFVHVGGCRYRVLEGDYYAGRKRRYAAFLVK